MSTILHAFFYLDRSLNMVDATTIPVSQGRDRTSLANSISMYGVFTPILVRRIPQGWQIISGQGRFQSSQNMLVPALEVRCNDEEALLLHIQDNLIRGFNVMEIATLIDRLHHHLKWPLAKVSQLVSSQLGLSSGTKILQDYLALLQLSPLVQQVLAQTNLPIRTAIVLTNFSADDATALIQLSQIMRWNANKQREIFTLLWEICHRDHTSVLQILQKPDILAFTQVENPSRFAEDLRFYIQAMKNPHANATQQEFQKLLRQVAWPTNVQIQPSPNFEKAQVHFEFDVGSMEEYYDIVRKLGSFEASLEQMLHLGESI